MTDQNAETTQGFQAQPYVTLGTIACTVKGYSGKTPVKQYFKEIEERAQLDGWSEDTKLKITRFRLEGEAKNFYEAELEEIANTLTWETFKKKFITKFTPIKIPGEAALHLANCYQRTNETIAEYVTRLKGIAKEIIEEDLSTAQEEEKVGIRKKNQGIILNQFQLGLKRDLKRQVLPKLIGEKNLTLEKAEQIAKTCELCEQMLNNNYKMNAMAISERKWCSNCKMSNHNNESCRKNFRKPFQGSSGNNYRAGYTPQFRQFNRRYNNYSEYNQRGQNYSRTYSRGNYNQLQQNSNTVEGNRKINSHQEKRYDPAQVSNYQKSDFRSYYGKYKNGEQNKNINSLEMDHLNEEGHLTGTRVECLTQSQ